MFLELCARNNLFLSKNELIGVFFKMVAIFSWGSIFCPIYEIVIRHFILKLISKIDKIIFIPII